MVAAASSLTRRPARVEPVKEIMSTSGCVASASPAVGSLTGVRDGSGNELQTLTLGGTSGGTFSVLFNGLAPVTTSEIQLLTFASGTANGGTFTLSLNGQVTAAITYSTTPATTVTNIQNALNTTFTAGLFTVTAFAANDLLNYVITATGGLANRSERDLPAGSTPSCFRPAAAFSGRIGSSATRDA